MHNIDLIVTLAGGLIAALCFGYITNLLRLSPITGYLLAGVAIGPYTPGFIANQQFAEQLAEIGVVLLMFGVGLHFHLKDLLAVRRVAIPGAVGQSVVATILGALLFRWLGWSWEAGIVYGMCLAVASTVVLTRVLVDNRALQTQTGHVAVGWLIVEDLFTVFILVVLPIVFGKGTESVFEAAGLATLKIGALVATVFLLGSKVIPRLFTSAAKSSTHELFTLTVLATALGIAVGSAMLFNVSMALGAFLAGMVVGRSEFSARAAAEALPMRDAFAVLFFVSVGMLLDPSTLVAHWRILLGTVGVVMIGKSLAAFAIVLLLGYPVRVALGVSAALSQIGEFSFILASLALSLGILDEVATNTMVAAAIISITLNPLVYRTVPIIDRWIAKRERLSKFLSARLLKRLPPEALDAATAGGSQQRAVVIGYGPTGRTVLRLLQEAGIDPIVIELNIETSRELVQRGVPAIYGDARRRETLVRAGVESARALILSATSISDPEEIVRIAKEINPSVRIFARTSYIRDTQRLRASGCEIVFSGEAEVAFALIQEVLHLYGVTLDELQRERIRLDLDGSSPGNSA